MKKRKGVLPSLINYQYLKQAKKQRGKGKEREGRRGGGGGFQYTTKWQTIALLKS